MKGRLTVLIAIILILAITPILTNDTTVDPIITQTLEKEETVQVVIQYIEEPEEPTFIETLLTDEIEQENINEEFYSAEITEDQLEDLLEDPNVQTISEDPVASVHLSTSTQVINSTVVNSKQFSSTNLTGLGQSVCVIDTGVNSSHPGLKGRIIAEKCFCDITDYGSGGCCSDNTNENSDAEDDYRHGTHVAGIIASNDTTYTGVAPEAYIVSVKVTNSSGNALYSDITQGIDWCRTNAATYNITAISISLGGGAYSAHCDATFAGIGLTGAVDNAYNNNVSVVISTGNDYSTSNIGSPSCIENAIAVSSTTKLDTVSSFSNWNSITDMFAPGGTSTGTGACPNANYICSTQWTSGFIGYSGTSMSAPHVAGVIALMQQYEKDVEGKPLTGDQVNQTITTNGALIDDSGGSGYSFYRLDALKSLIAIDNLQPEILNPNTTLQTFYFYNNITFIANVSDINLDTVWIEGNWSGSLENTTLTNTVDAQYNFTLDNGNYSNSDTFSWRIHANDSNNNINSTDFYTITIAGNPTVTLNSPADGSMTNNATVYFNFTATDELDSLINCSLYLDSISNITNTTVNNGTSTIFELDLNSSDHTWFVQCTDSNNLTTNSSSRTLTVDTLSPYFTAENFTSIIELGANWSYIVNITNSHLSYANFSFDSSNVTMSNVTDIFNRTFQVLDNGSQAFVVYAYDTAGNLNSTNNTFIVNDSISGVRIMNFNYNSTVAQDSNQTVTTYLLNSFPITEAYITYNGTNYNFTNNTHYNFTTTFSVSACGDYNFTMFTNDTQGENKSQFTNFSINFCCGNGIPEGDEDCNTCPGDTSECDEPATTSGGGGGGGGSGTSEESTKETIKISSASPDDPIEFNIYNTILPINKLEVLVERQVENIKVTAEVLDEKPSETVNPQGEVYKFLEIYTTNLNEEDIEQAEIQFFISSTWLNNKDKDSVILQRYNRGWEQLPTEYIKLYQDNYYFKAETEGFSYFVITAIEEEETIEEEITAQAVEEVVEDVPQYIAPAPEQEIEEFYFTPFIMSIGIIITLAVIIVALAWRKKWKI